MCSDDFAFQYFKILHLHFVKVSISRIHFRIVVCFLLYFDLISRQDSILSLSNTSSSKSYLSTLRSVWERPLPLQWAQIPDIISQQPSVCFPKLQQSQLSGKGWWFRIYSEILLSPLGVLIPNKTLATHNFWNTLHYFAVRSSFAYLWVRSYLSGFPSRCLQHEKFSNICMIMWGKNS